MATAHSADQLLSLSLPEAQRALIPPLLYSACTVAPSGEPAGSYASTRLPAAGQAGQQLRD